MNEFIGEDAFTVPPFSTAALEEIGEQLLAELVPEALNQPTELDVLGLIDTVLPGYGIHVGPASEIELGPRHAATDTAGSDSIDILIRPDHWEDLIAGRPRDRFARSTIIHELVHAILHVPVIRRRRDMGQQHLLNRLDRSSIPPYRDSEWQAYTLAGCILIPRKTLSLVSQATVSKVADIFGVHPAFVRSHLRRLKINMKP